MLNTSVESTITAKGEESSLIRADCLSTIVTSSARRHSPLRMPCAPHARPPKRSFGTFRPNPLVVNLVGRWVPSDGCGTVLRHSSGYRLHRPDVSARSDDGVSAGTRLWSSGTSRGRLRGQRKEVNADMTDIRTARRRRYICSQVLSAEGGLFSPGTNHLVCYPPPLRTGPAHPRSIRLSTLWRDGSQRQ